MRPDDRAKLPGAKPRDHRHDHGGRHAPTTTKNPPPGWNNKTMHHPATRIGEIKHGKT